MQMSMFSSEELRANLIPSPGCERDWTIHVVNSCLPTYQLLGNIIPGILFGKMSPVSFRATRDETLEAFWDCLPEDTLNAPQEDGKTAESYRATRTHTASHGECLTLSISEYHSAAVASSLSDILETGDVPQRFFLSVTACKGILRRAEKRGKKLPEHLQAALKAAVGDKTQT